MLILGFIYRPNPQIMVKRPIEGVTPKKTKRLVNQDGSVMKFHNRDKAITFLKANGFDTLTTQEIKDSFIFEETC